jgi:hypothetical protein
MGIMSEIYRARFKKLTRVERALSRAGFCIQYNHEERKNPRHKIKARVLPYMEGKQLFKKQQEHFDLFKKMMRENL